jgi:cysteine-rich repeat protein
MEMIALKNIKILVLFLVVMCLISSTVAATAITYTIESYSDSSYSTIKNEFTPGETVYGRGTRSSSANMRLRYLDPSDSVVNICSYSDTKTVYCNYALPSDAPIGDWKIQIGRCSYYCNNINNWDWNYATDHFTILAPVCGNNILETGEECDDGDTDNNDGCSSLCVTESIWYHDGDLDGYGDVSDSTMAVEAPSEYIADATDCDDTSSSCNTDCEAQSYADADLDGFGDGMTSARSCDAPEGYVSDNTDCDDTTSSCNIDCETQSYADADLDGFGDGMTSARSCDAPEGYISDNTDCDDTSSSCNTDCETQSYADADFDTFGDGMTSARSCDAPEGYISDNTDCDDTSSSCNTDCETQSYADADFDTFGDGMTSARSCDAPEGYILESTDCDDADNARFPGNPETCDGKDNDCDGTVDDGRLQFASETFVSNICEPINYYCDNDEDGERGTAIESCNTFNCMPESCSLEAGNDCDDSDELAYPDAIEVCNGVDDNCDGIVDDGDEEQFIPQDDSQRVCSVVEYYCDNDQDNSRSSSVSDSCDSYNCVPEWCSIEPGTDCDDSNSGIWQLLDGYTDSDNDGLGSGDSVSVCSGEGLPEGYYADSTDTIFGSSSSLSSNLDLLFEVDDVLNPNSVSGEGNVEFINSADNETIIEFGYDFDVSGLDLSKVNITSNPIAGAGGIIIQGIDLTGQNATKTVYINKLLSGNTVCIIDAEVTSIAVTNDCSNGIKLTCDGTSGPYTCTTVGSKYKITGLTHSAVSEYSYTAPVAASSSSGGSSGGGSSGGGGGGFLTSGVKKIVAPIETPKPAETSTSGPNPSVVTLDENTAAPQAGNELTGAVIGGQSSPYANPLYIGIGVGVILLGCLASYLGYYRPKGKAPVVNEQPK